MNQVSENPVRDINYKYQILSLPHVCSGQHSPSGTLTTGTYPIGQFMLITGQLLLLHSGEMSMLLKLIVIALHCIQNIKHKRNVSYGKYKRNSKGLMDSFD